MGKRKGSGETRAGVCAIMSRCAIIFFDMSQTVAT
jgi:hypothetical protein